jgi:hypothetical protein
VTLDPLDANAAESQLSPPWPAAVTPFTYLCDLQGVEDAATRLHQRSLCELEV